MTPDVERFRRVEEAFRLALAADPADRGRVIDEACAGDASIAGEVRGLLEADAIDDLLTLGGRTADTHAAPSPRPALGGPDDVPARIGAYTLEAPIGRGGMGVVYRARREHPARTVALKIVRRSLTGENTLRRFRLEAEALARLQHPGIASLYEIGLGDDEDQPFFAMELIDGEPITTYAEHHKLSVSQRLGLLARVCDAIEHAHTRGVVHRDLKPENVLVNAEGQPKVLDLGIAKLLDTENDAETAVTRQGQIIGTLGYMSPEQVSGDPHAVDPRSDVYALGVMGYELVAGRRPIETTGLGMYAAIHQIRHAEPPSLAAARPGLDPDISTIIGKAIEKEADGRYQSAAHLAADLRRFLADEPILARPPSTLYQLSKFAKRNRVLVGAVAAIIVMLAVSLVAVAASLRTAHAARRQAETEREITEAVNAFLLDDLIATADPRQGGSKDITLIDALNSASETLGDRFAASPDSEAAIRAALGEIYSTLNDFPRATLNTRRALELTPEGDPALRVDRLNALALLHMDLGENDEARAALVQAQRIVDTDLRGDTTRRLDVLSNLGRVAYKSGDRERAFEIYRRVAEEGGREMPDDPITTTAIGAVSLILQQLGRPDEALPMSERVVHIDEERYGPEHPDTLTTLTNHALLLTKLKRYDEAEAILRRVLETRERTMGDDNVDTNVTRAVYASLMLEEGRADEAAGLARTACEKLTAVLGSDHRYTRSACETAERAAGAEP